MDDASPVFLQPFSPIERHANRLPHWQQSGAAYFVTFHLADSIPADALAEWRDARDAWIRIHPRPWTREQEREFHARFSMQKERWLDAGAGACILREPCVSRIVGDALVHFDAQRCLQHAWVVMPNHVHALFSLMKDERLEDLVHSWKSFTAHAVNKLLKRAGPMWHVDYFDRMIRDVEHFERCRKYIRKNPAKSGLKEGEFLLYERSAEGGVPPPD